MVMVVMFCGVVVIIFVYFGFGGHLNEKENY